MKIYIAGKITGLDNYKNKFNEAEKRLKEEGHICMNPSILPEGFEWEEYMHICYNMIDVCEAVYFLDNWLDSKGAKQEYVYANATKKTILFEGDLVDGRINSLSKCQL